MKEALTFGLKSLLLLSVVMMSSSFIPAYGQDTEERASRRGGSVEIQQKLDLILKRQDEILNGQKRLSEEHAIIKKWVHRR